MFVPLYESAAVSSVPRDIRRNDCAFVLVVQTGDRPYLRCNTGIICYCPLLTEVKHRTTVTDDTRRINGLASGSSPTKTRAPYLLADDLPRRSHGSLSYGGDKWACAGAHGSHVSSVLRACRVDPNSAGRHGHDKEPTALPSPESPTLAHKIRWK